MKINSRKHKSYKLHEPFDVTYIISFKGLTESDGVFTVTPAMIIDKVAEVLDVQIQKGFITEVNIQFKQNRKTDK